MSIAFTQPGESHANFCTCQSIEILISVKKKQFFFVPFESEYAELQRDFKNHSLGEFVSLGNENTTY